MVESVTIPELTEDRDEAITARRFVCETHDAPGECTEECVRLLDLMSGDESITFDPTGCTYPAPRPRIIYAFDADTMACVEVTLTPVDLLDDTTYALVLGDD